MVKSASAGPVYALGLFGGSWREQARGRRALIAAPAAPIAPRDPGHHLTRVIRRVAWYAPASSRQR